MAPSAWVLALRFDGGGYRAGGKAMFDSQGNLWVGDNFTIGWQARDALWQGPATKFAPNGRALSPMTTGFTGGGMYGGTFGAAIDAEDNAWFGTYGGQSIAVFDKTGRPLTPPEGVTFDHKLGLMQGIIVTPSGDVWALGLSKNQVVFFPKGDRTKGKIVCEGRTGDPCRVTRGGVSHIFRSCAIHGSPQAEALLAFAALTQMLFHLRRGGRRLQVANVVNPFFRCEVFRHVSSA